MRSAQEMIGSTNVNIGSSYLRNWEIIRKIKRRSILERKEFLEKLLL